MVVVSSSLTTTGRNLSPPPILENLACVEVSPAKCAKGGRGLKIRYGLALAPCKPSQNSQHGNEQVLALGAAAVGDLADDLVCDAQRGGRAEAALGPARESPRSRSWRRCSTHRCWS
jgi:hypothetical protein